MTDFNENIVLTNFCSSSIDDFFSAAVLQLYVTQLVLTECSISNYASASKCNFPLDVTYLLWKKYNQSSSCHNESKAKLKHLH